MLEVNYKKELGRIIIEQDGRRFNLGIYEANCQYGAVVWTGKDEKGELRRILMTFWADEQHMKNIVKNEGSLMCGEKVLRAELNMYHKENYTLLKYMMASGYKVKCYLREPKTK